MKSNDLRETFLRFFEERDHERVASSSLLPANDPTLLFTNAGMVQFKDVFTGREKRSYKRAVSSQRCVRAGGKHNDLENVGYTARHHTFFEMLGNFSFGDYFKREAIAYAWEFLTETVGLPAEKLWVTVYADDEEAARIWLDEIGVSEERFSRIGDEPGGKKYQSDNFWAMGETGPCGPCSEIFYDHGPDVSGGPPGSEDEDGDRYVEIWNLVFMQYERDENGTMTDLPAPCVDTGMGLERIAAVLQGEHSNYEIDLFRNLMDAAREATGAEAADSPSLKVVADHIRACAFLIVDGVLPSNEGRGYVLRRIIRRAIRHGYKLGQKQPFFHTLVAALDVEMGEAYPELRKARAHLEKVLKKEEERFAETLDDGMRLLESVIADMDGEEIPGDAVFKLYDTHGFPVDLTADIARERGLSVDHAGFEAAMAAQRQRARAASSFTADYDSEVLEGLASRFTGYHTLEDQGRVLAIVSGDRRVDAATAGDEVQVVLDVTPFYAEGGGQVGDTGELTGDDARLVVTDTQRQGEAVVHIARVEKGELRQGDTVTARVDRERREATVLNHTATHLLHAALREILGEHVKQKGSLVAPDRLRFDFSHYEAVSPDELVAIEDLVNDKIRENLEARTAEMGFEEAMQAGALAFFDEKYGERVRVLQIGDFSTELCGGTHASRAGDIGLFKITQETGISAGTRRIEAVTGQGALARVREDETRLHEIGSLLKGGRDEVGDKVRGLMERNRALEKELDRLRAKLASGESTDLASQAVEVDGMKVLAARLDGADAKALRDAVDQLKNKLESAAIVLGAEADGKVRLVAGVTRDRVESVKAGELVNHVAGQVGGKGGGRADMAQAGGTEPEKLDQALASVEAWVRARLETA